jgi:hypothetical protein
MVQHATSGAFVKSRSVWREKPARCGSREDLGRRGWQEGTMVFPPPPASARRTQGWVVPWNCSASVEPARATVADAPRVTASTTASK